ncbi:glycoside hydrolase family 25 protein [Virgibacillus sp. NKC19-3]|uniref:glycoside hydrolase family 25 protein n=1 Tax=Virgibacillus saliphilus TaxID=2831674 RepID=UPI001C9B70CD|nr:glycoside hydrolase family 25 protein [Virgibacillus sp. NKC19-3]MBY7143582.1 glycoside hydrolase family 25 protein [Virgibacillus sp. NKC19-3]
MGKKFIDVSHYQGNIDWNQVANDGIEGTYIKATEGSAAGAAFVDSQKDTNFTGATSNGLDAGFYHYAKFISVNDAIEEADWFIEHIKEHDFTLPPMLDLEENNCPSVSVMNQAAKAFLEHVEEELGSAGLYSFGNFFENNVDKSLLDDYAYWHARYASDPVNVNLSDIYLWQYSNNGNVAGITENVVDLNETGGQFFTVGTNKKD